MKKVFLGVLVMLLSVSLFVFPALGSTIQPITIYACDSLPAEMSAGEVVTDFGLGYRTLYSDACIKINGNVILNASFPAIDATNYAVDGIVHFYIYVSDADNAGSLTLELGGLSWSISNLDSGWNEIWLPVCDALGTPSWSALNNVRLTAHGSQI